MKHTAKIKLDEETAEEMAEFLSKSAAVYDNMFREASRNGDVLAANDFRRKRDKAERLMSKCSAAGHFISEEVIGITVDATKDSEV